MHALHIGEVHVLRYPNQTDEQVSAYLLQPFDGLMDYNALTTYPKFSLSFKKTCSSSATMTANAGVLMLNSFDSVSCESFNFTRLDDTSSVCGPMFTIGTWGLDFADVPHYKPGIIAITDQPDIYVAHVSERREEGSLRMGGRDGF